MRVKTRERTPPVDGSRLSYYKDMVVVVLQSLSLCVNDVLVVSLQDLEEDLVNDARLQYLLCSLGAEAKLLQNFLQL